MIDLDLRSSKLDKEQQRRRDEAKKKREREIALQKEQARREQELALRAAQKREEDERAELERQLAEAEEQRITGGIHFTHILRAYQIDGEDDKVILPEDCLTELTQQDAFTRGAMTFQLKYTYQSKVQITHCGVREFSAPAGSIGIPKKVIDSFSSINLEEHCAMEIKYVRLSKCTFAKLQPKHNNFIEVGPVKMCLEENLRFHTTLTVGDVLTVWYRGKAHELCVTEMRPEPKCTLVDTDVEVELTLSEEYERHQREQQQPGQVVGQQIGTSVGGHSAGGHSAGGHSSSSGGTGSGGAGAGVRGPSPSSLSHAGAVPAAAPSTTVFHTLGGASAAGTTTSMTTAPALLPSSSSGAVGSGVVDAAALDDLRRQLRDEPAVNDSASIAIKVRLPSGVTKQRRFAHSSAVAQLFLFVLLELLQAGGVGPDGNVQEMLSRLQLMTRFPARTIRWADINHSNSVVAGGVSGGGDGRGAKGAGFGEGVSFAELGFTSASEAVFVSLL